MRDETRKRIERAIWRERLKKIGLAAGGLTLIGSLFAVENLDLMVEDHRVAGVVEHITPMTSKSIKAARDSVDVSVRLDDGRHIEVLTHKATDPHVGDKVEVTEHVHATGRRTFSWK